MWHIIVNTLILETSCSDEPTDIAEAPGMHPG